jgi:hypothetical protein
MVCQKFKVLWEFWEVLVCKGVAKAGWRG